MRKITKEIILMVLIILSVLSINLFQKSYANSEKEELILMLDEMKPDLGNMKQFKEVMDLIYNDLNPANQVDDNLKEKLKKDINKLSEVEGMNSAVATALIDELQGQVDSLTDETLPEMKEEISIMKEWADENQEEPQEPPTPPTTPSEPSEPSTPSEPNNPDVSISDKNFPYAGIRNVAYIVVLIVVLIFGIIVAKKYRKLKDI